MSALFKSRFCFVFQIRRARPIFALIVAIAVIEPSTTIAQTTPNPAASPSAASTTPNSFIPFTRNGQPVRRVFVFAVSGDPPTRAKFAAVLTHRLEKDYVLGQTQLVAEPDWGLSDYVNACQNFAAYTAGALIVQIGEISNISTSFLLLKRSSKTRIHAALLYSSCAAPIPPSDPSPIPKSTTESGGSIVTSQLTTIGKKDHTQQTNSVVSTINWSPAPGPSPSPNYSFTWQSDMEGRTGTPVTLYTPLSFLGAILTFASGVVSLFPSRTLTTVATRNFPTPMPYQTLPPGGVVSLTSSTTSTVTNPDQLGTVASGLFGTSLTYASSVESASTSDLQSLNAVDAVLDDLLDDLACQPTPAYQSTRGYVRKHPPSKRIPEDIPAPVDYYCPIYSSGLMKLMKHHA